MKVLCPRCTARIPVSNISLEAGWGKCEDCQEIFRLVDIVPGFPTSEKQLDEPVQRPFNARAVVERTTEKLLIHIPAAGMTAAIGSILGFAIFWLGFVAFWTCGALGLFANQPPQAFNFAFASFSIPFWIVGFGMLIGVAWSLWGTKSIWIDREGMRTNQRCLVWSRSKWIEIDRLQHARRYNPYVTNGNEQQTYAVEIVYRASSFVLPTDSEEEGRWLIAEINNFMRSLQAS